MISNPFRYIAAAVVARTAGFVLTGVAETGEDAVLAATRLRPALVLMDVRLPGIDGVEAARRIVTADPNVDQPKQAPRSTYPGNWG